MITSSIFVRLSRIPPRRALFSFLLFLLVAQLITWTLLPDHIKEYPLRWLSRLGQYAEAAEPIDENLLQNVDNQTQITLSQFRLNRVTKKYYGTATITNTSSSDLPKPIYLVVNSTVPDSVKVTNHHGVTIVSNKPYYDISSLIEGDKLAASAITKPLTLEMTNPQNVQFKIYLSVYILAAGHPPVAIPGGPYFGEAGVPIGFDGSASTDPDGDILTYEWTFGDGATETRPNPTHVYATAGIYTVRLTVNDGHEGINTAETTATVTGHPAISVAPQALAFGTVQVGSSKDELLTFSNTGTDTLTITSITSDNEVFSVPQVQEFNIAVGGKPVVVPVKFTPNMDGDHSGVITITSNDPNASSTTVSASGYGIAPAQPPNIVVSPAELSFGDTFLSSSQDMELTITNSGEGLLSVSDIASDNPDFSVMPPALFDIQSNGTPRKVAIRFNPSTLGLVSGNITITSDDPDTAQVTIPVSGNGIQSVQPPDILVSPNSLAFGNVFLEASSVKNVSIANEGEGILTVSSAELDNASASEYKIMNTFPITIAPGKAPVNLSVEYKPLASGQAPDVNLLIDSDDPDEPQITVPLSGNGVEPVKVIEGAPEPPLNAQVVPTNNLNPNNVINAESQFDVHVLAHLRVQQRNPYQL